MVCICQNEPEAASSAETCERDAIEIENVAMTASVSAILKAEARFAGLKFTDGWHCDDVYVRSVRIKNGFFFAENM